MRATIAVLVKIQRTFRGYMTELNMSMSVVIEIFAKLKIHMSDVWFLHKYICCRCFWLGVMQRCNVSLLVGFGTNKFRAVCVPTPKITYIRIRFWRKWIRPRVSELCINKPNTNGFRLWHQREVQLLLKHTTQKIRLHRQTPADTEHGHLRLLQK